MKSLKYFGKLKKPRLLIIRQVVGDSMVPTLRPRTIVAATSYYKRLAAGDIVLIRHAGLEKIKRVSQIKADRIFVVGDNQDRSTDSRAFGWLHQSAIIAKVIWPRKTV